MKTYNVNFNNGEVVNIVEADDVNEAKTLFAHKLVDMGKEGGVFLLRNKIKVTEIENKEDKNMDDMKMDVVEPEQDEVTENFIAPTPIIPAVAAPKRKVGRPINPKSANQARIKAREAKIAAGIEIKRGRPIDPNSIRQMKIRAKA